jgi:hypothetical protein
MEYAELATLHKWISEAAKPEFEYQYKRDALPVLSLLETFCPPMQRIAMDISSGYIYSAHAADIITMVVSALRVAYAVDPARPCYRILDEAYALMESKNHDYRGGSGDPFANFRRSVELGVEPEVGLLMRMLDKIQRIKTFATKGELAVKGEPVWDAIVDIINYAVLCYGLLIERGRAQKPVAHLEGADA